MKKWISIIGAIGLTATSTTTLISCNKENNNNENKENNKTKLSYNPQQPPENSNWKLINRDNFVKENNEKNNKWYILIAKQMQSDNFSIIKFNFSSELIWKVGEHGGHRINNRWYVYIHSLYRWDGAGEPETPTINKDTGEITDWK
ncbi:Spiroplasmavirus-related protein [Spiroplasma kunkelii CR2-3x]|uniref:Spiroplasmavirus-related protein n=1 Tax=Spiroplasma kunkelii CR2-3x TaxID=273035 RepID=A0A0K2JHP4_SPIKU|nr:lipoprotein [Spiroplasma kunkelii]ALA98120.1 Spiroplasmavirus-related protein [Spiroplasma kunkelii CR2-3x]